MFNSATPATADSGTDASNTRCAKCAGRTRWRRPIHAHHNIGNIHLVCAGDEVGFMATTWKRSRSSTPSSKGGNAQLARVSVDAYVRNCRRHEFVQHHTVTAAVLVGGRHVANGGTNWRRRTDV
ncbi:unnamed protein product [Sphagnum balticum]